MRIEEAITYAIMSIYRVNRYENARKSKKNENNLKKNDIFLAYVIFLLYLCGVFYSYYVSDYIFFVAHVREVS